MKGSETTRKGSEWPADHHAAVRAASREPKGTVLEPESLPFVGVLLSYRAAVSMQSSASTVCNSGGDSCDGTASQL